MPLCQLRRTDHGYRSPLMSYDSVTSDVNRLAKCKNFTMFNRDLNDNKLPQWMFITPNMSKHSSISSR